MTDYEYYEPKPKKMKNIFIEYKQKDIAKKLGAKWNAEIQFWQVREEEYDKFIEKFNKLIDK